MNGNFLKSNQNNDKRSYECLKYDLTIKSMKSQIGSFVSGL